MIGLNGGGKTTLTYCLCGVSHYLKGTMQDCPGERENTRNPLSGLSGEIDMCCRIPACSC